MSGEDWARYPDDPDRACLFGRSPRNVSEMTTRIVIAKRVILEADAEIVHLRDEQRHPEPCPFSCGCVNGLNAEIVRLKKIQQEWFVWSCSHCGPHPGSSSRWCDAGCGPDFNVMTRVTLAEALEGQA